MNRRTARNASPANEARFQGLVSVPVGANQLGVSKHTLRTWLREGRLAYVRLGRRVLLDPKTLESFVRAHVIDAR